MTSPRIIQVESHATGNGGILNPYFRNWEEQFHEHSVRMVYTTTMKTGDVKGPILHTDSTQLLTCVSGVCRIEYIECQQLLCNMHPNSCVLRDKHIVNALLVPPHVWYRLLCDDDCIVMNMPNVSWHPDRPNGDKLTASTWDDAKKQIDFAQ